MTGPAKSPNATKAAKVPSAKILKLAVPFLGVLGALQGADPNIASTALVGATRGLSMEGGLVALAASISTLALAASVISTGLWADRLGRRRVLMAALLLTIIGDLIVAIAPTSAFFLLGRAVAGVGLGAIFGASFAYLRAVVPADKIPGAMGIFGASIGIFTLVFTFIGGSLSAIDWRVAFLLIPIASAICFFLVPIVLPAQEPVSKGKQDIVGQVLLAIGVIAFLYGVSHLGTSLTDLVTWGPLVGGVILLAAFFVYESKNSNHFFPVSLFRNRIFIAAVFVGLVYNFGTAMSFLQITNLWQYVNGEPTSIVSIWQLGFLIPAIFAALIFGKLMLKGMSNRTAVLIAGVGIFVGMVWLALFNAATSYWLFLPGLVILGAALTIVSLPYGNLIMKEAPPAYFGPVTSSRTTIGQFFYAIGLALSTVIIDKMTIGGTVDTLTQAGVPASKIGTGLDAVKAFAAQSTEPTSALGKQALAAASDSYGNGFATVMIIGAVLSIVGAVVAAILLKGDSHPTEQTVETTQATK